MVRSPTLLLFGDLHLRKGHLIQGQECCDSLVATAKKVKPDLIVLMGDVLHTHEMVYVPGYRLLENLVKLLRKIAPVKIIIGNHDFISASENQTPEHPLGPFKEWDRVEVVDHAIEDLTFIDQGYRLVLTPYIPYGHFLESIDPLLSNESSEVVDLVLAHQPFLGVDPKAEAWPDDYPMVISGHIHDRKLLQPNVYYTGSSSQVDCDEKPDKYACLVTLSPEGIKYKSIRLAVRSISIIRTTYDALTSETSDAEGGEAQEILDLAQRHEVKLIISGTREEKIFFSDLKLAETLGSIPGLKVEWDLPLEKIVPRVPRAKRGDFKSILKTLVDASDEKVKKAYEEIYGGEVDGGEDVEEE